MPDTKQMTVRDYALRSALAAWDESMGPGKYLWVELVAGREPAEHVECYGARARSRGLVRVGIVSNVPDEHGSYFHGADLHPADVARWFGVRGVPVVRISARPPVM